MALPYPPEQEAGKTMLYRFLQYNLRKCLKWKPPFNKWSFAYYILVIKEKHVHKIIVIIKMPLSVKNDLFLHVLKLASEHIQLKLL